LRRSSYGGAGRPVQQVEIAAELVERRGEALVARVIGRRDDVDIEVRRRDP
jgi:hypothetical protein